MKKSRKDTQIEAVKAILAGELLLEEAMEKYDVRDKRTILNWMKSISPLIQNKTEPVPDVHEYVIKENSLLRRVIGLQDQLRELEEKNAQILAQRNVLMDKVTRLELKLQVQDNYETTSDA
ncbi:hypothetical protein [Sphingobacterium haloxyli]|uniref:Transposase n=1 Tax=Sphingobacterium haloxyli TaxID=2100533 RepID=A0A2S9IYB2_9SPHI|nr:hypothetical protein [Sphingobacterium haloxyli]PRD45515.1 hypothetical protein C5745_18160 [Sphingobacterium haloxyli]